MDFINEVLLLAQLSGSFGGITLILGTFSITDMAEKDSLFLLGVLFPLVLSFSSYSRMTLSKPVVRVESVLEED